MRRAFLVLALLVVGACSSGDDDDADAGEEDTTTTEGESEGNAGDREDQAIADEAVLALDDMPPGWEAAPPGDEEQEQADQDEFDRRFAECLEIDVSEVQSDSPTAESNFVSSNDERVHSTVTVGVSEAELQEDIDRLRDEAAQTCFVEEIGQSFAEVALSTDEDIELGEPTFNELSFEDLGDDSIAFRLTVPVSAGGLDAEVYFDYVTARKGRVGVNHSFQSVLTPFDEAEAQELTEIVLDRIPADA